MDPFQQFRKLQGDTTFLFIVISSHDLSFFPNRFTRILLTKGRERERWLRTRIRQSKGNHCRREHSWGIMRTCAHFSRMGSCGSWENKRTSNWEPNRGWTEARPFVSTAHCLQQVTLPLKIDHVSNSIVLFLFLVVSHWQFHKTLSIPFYKCLAL